MLNNYKFAIIEDFEPYVALVGLIVARHGTVMPYKEVSQFEDKDYDAVFCDLRLKETWGVDTITALRAKTAAPIIVLTALGGPYLSATEMQALLEAGANEVFSKEIVNDPSFTQLVIDIIERVKLNVITA